MGFFRQLSTNMGLLSKRVLPNAPIGNQEIGLTQLNYSGVQDPSDREAIYPDWFFSSRLGQPRQVDTIKIRNLAQSPWTQMVLSTFKKQVSSTAWGVVVADEKDDTDRSADIKKVNDFLLKINKNNQTIDDINSETITDISEIDAGIWNFIYSADSYLIGELPVYDAWGRVIGNETGLILKPLGSREIVAVKTADGSSILKQVDIHKNLLNYWQYSFKHPRQNPTRFEPEEIEYFMMNNKSYNVYGFSPVQSIQQVIELLIQGTRYNKDLYTNNAIPDWLVSLPKLPSNELKKLKREWNNSYKGKPHQIGFINWAIEKFQKLADSNRDLEWLNGQMWYFKLVFAVFGVSPTEAGFFENSNRSNDEGQERVTVRNALKPYFKKFETAITNRLITEILQKEDHGLKFEYQPKDHASEKIEFEQDIQELDHGTLTINEFRKKKGRESVEWGDDPLRRPFDPTNSYMNFGGETPNVPPNSNNSGNGNQNNSKEPKKPNEPTEPKKSMEKDLEIDAGDDIVNEAKDYSDFLLKFFDKFEKKVISAVDKIEIEKSYNANKTFGEFLTNLFNTVNSIAFAKNIRKFIKADLIAGLVSAESELSMDIGFTENYQDKLNILASQQIEGYMINGKKWYGIKGVSKEIQAKIIKTVQNGIQEKKSLDQIKEEVKNTFDGFSEWRSEMISRTETNRILSEGKLLGYKESGLEGKKVWSAVLDNRTSEICKRLNGQKRELDESFIDPETKKAFMTNPSHPQCRCTLYFQPL